MIGLGRHAIWSAQSQTEQLRESLHAEHLPVPLQEVHVTDSKIQPKIKERLFLEPAMGCPLAPHRRIPTSFEESRWISPCFMPCSLSVGRPIAWALRQWSRPALVIVRLFGDAPHGTRPRLVPANWIKADAVLIM